MYYFEVLVSSPQFHGSEALTYCYPEKLAIGTVVSVPLRQRTQLGLVVANAKKPTYTTKPILVVLATRPVPKELLSLLSWLYEFYPSPLGLIAQQALPSGLLLSKPPEAPTPTVTTSELQPLPPLSPEQHQVATGIATSKQRRFLIHGDTGTGKTRIYMELTKETLASGASVMIITPEIGLTPQLVASFTNHLAAEVIVLHSHQTPAERREQWLRILYSDNPQIIIGPRSALFAPVKRLGLVIVDEAHDGALKQDKAPRYHALRVAAKLAQLHNARFVSGSATPRISEYWLAEQTGTPILRITELPNNKKIEREIIRINLKDKDHFSKSNHLSTELLQAIEKALRNKQQSLVFLNRRGTARLVMCQNCGWQALCPTCDLPLTYHGDHHEMRCHTCGYHTTPPTACPECSSYNIVFRSLGTKSLVTELQKFFPKARIKRYDTDNKKDERIESNYDAVAAGEVDIIVGTQLIAKGLDLPHLAVVGVVLADTSLYLPDYSAEEQTYQMITQVIGRVGRGHTKGTVVIQSYQPESPSITAAVNNDWPTFYRSQLTEREAFGFPPFYHFLKLTISRSTSQSAVRAAEQLIEHIKTARYRVQIVGPSPAFHEKQGGKYHWQLLIKAKDRRELTRLVADIPKGWNTDIDPDTLL